MFSISFIEHQPISLKNQMIKQWLWIDISLWLVFLLQSQTLNVTEGVKELLDHWLADPGNNTLMPALVPSLYQQQFFLFCGNKPSSFCFVETSKSLSSEPMTLVCPWSMRLVTLVTVFLTLGKCSLSARDDLRSKGHEVLFALHSPWALFSIVTMELRTDLCIC